MIHILLLILKIAGIILAVLLGLVLLLLAVILFVPIRYTFAAQYDRKPILKIKATWLLHLLNFVMAYDEELKIRFRITGFTLYASDAETKEEPQDSEKKNHTKKKHTKKEEKTVFEELEQRHEQMTQKAESVGVERQQKAAEEKHEQQLLFEKPEESFQRKSIDRYVQQFWEKIMAFFKKIADTARGIRDKSISLKETVEEKTKAFSDMVNDTQNRELVRFLWENIRKLLKLLRPRKYRVWVRYGFEDTEITGWLAVRLAVVYGLLGMDMELIPDFEQSIFEGEIFLKGKIRLFGITVIALKVYFNRLVREKILKKKR